MLNMDSHYQYFTCICIGFVYVCTCQRFCFFFFFLFLQLEPYKSRGKEVTWLMPTMGAGKLALILSF